MSDSSFTLKEHVFTAALPKSDAEPQVWTITVTKDGQEVKRITVPLGYRPLFGPDVIDVTARDARVEELIKELGLE